MDCECGAWSGEACYWSGPIDETVVVEYMPEHLRASHLAAGDRGQWPQNGAVRIRVPVRVWPAHGGARKRAHERTHGELRMPAGRSCPETSSSDADAGTKAEGYCITGGQGDCGEAP